MDSDNATLKDCEAENKCITVPTVTQSFIRKQLSNSSPAWVAHDDNSYSTLTQGASYEYLTINKLVSLPKLNISAVRAYYYKKDSGKKCSTTNLPKESNGCINKLMYDNLYKVLTTLKQT